MDFRFRQPSLHHPCGGGTERRLQEDVAAPATSVRHGHPGFRRNRPSRIRGALKQPAHLLSERKWMLRFIIEAVTLVREGEEFTVNAGFR